VIASRSKGVIYLPNKSEDNLLSVEMRQRLTDAILRLPDRERLVFTLYYYQELTKAEVGLLLGETGSSVSQLHASALMHLEAWLSD
jgi:RNA polymerase sigma factor for flagellar operon FliA